MDYSLPELGCVFAVAAVPQSWPFADAPAAKSVVAVRLGCHNLEGVRPKATVLRRLPGAKGEQAAVFPNTVLLQIVVVASIVEDQSVRYSKGLEVAEVFPVGRRTSS